MTESHNKIIDPHLHLFNLQRGDYAWLKPQNPPFWSDKHLINKNFIEADILLSPPNQLAGFVHIEAGFDNHQPWREIDWLQQHCTLPFKSVAFADITTTTFAEHLEQLKQRNSVVGIRHILDDQAEQILSSTLIHRHFELLAEYELSFANGGDQNNNTIPERPICDQMEITLIDGLGDKIQSSSWLLKK